MITSLCLFVVIVLQTSINATNIRSYTSIGNWANWWTGYHVNDAHNGFIDIGDNTFRAENLKLSYVAPTNCSNAYPIFANGTYFCTSKNMLFAHDPQDGSLSFWYLSIGSTNLQNPTFSTAEGDSSIFIYSYPSQSSAYNQYVMDFALVNPQTGALKNINTLPTQPFHSYSTLPFPAATPYGHVYFISSDPPPSYKNNASVSAYNIQTYQSSKSPADLLNTLDGTVGTPVLCDNTVIVSDGNGFVYAYNPAPYFKKQWTFAGEGQTNQCDTIHTNHRANPPVCYRNENGYRVIVRPCHGYNCYVLNAMNGELVSRFPCPTMPIFHYNETSGFADIVVVGTGQSNQVIAVQMDGDNFVGKELWYGDGDVDQAFIVKDYFVTAYVGHTHFNMIQVKAYNVITGDIAWHDQVQDHDYYSSSSYSIVGSLYTNGDREGFMIIVRNARGAMELRLWLTKIRKQCNILQDYKSTAFVLPFRSILYDIFKYHFNST
eukprot:657243_1